VKLNNVILNNIQQDCFLSIVPIAGDQGAAYGAMTSTLYRNFNIIPKFGDLKYGIRFKHFPHQTNNALVEQIAQEIIRGNIVNLIGERMEFGPRALGSTSTVCLPTKENVSIINQVNNRNDFMPVCPILLERNKDRFFLKEEYDKIIGSDHFMILTYRSKDGKNVHPDYDGIFHRHPLGEYYTARPQFVSEQEKDSFIYCLLSELEKRGVYCLINTSFNVHGVPIVYTHEQQQNSFNVQKENKIKLGISKVISLLHIQ
jgi:predicted NodU family carbamoyl transferase